MTERDFERRHGGGLGRGAVEPLSPQAWQRVESAVFTRLDMAALPWSLAPGPVHSYAAPRADRSLRLHWATSVGLALASAAAAASVLHLTRPPAPIEAGPPAELMLPAQPGRLPDIEPALTAPQLHASARAMAPPVESEPLRARPVPPLARPRADSLAASASTQLARPTPRREPAEPTPPRSDREHLFERAASLESADAPLALAMYLSLASGHDDWAANALYAAARLEIDRGLSDAGAEHLTEYLARFPRGENIVDVRRLRQRIGWDDD